MGEINPLWSSARELAYTEAAIIATMAGSETKLTSRSIVRRLSPKAAGYVMELACGHDERPADSFLDDLYRDGVITYDTEACRYGVGEFGKALVIAWMEEWAGNP